MAENLTKIPRRGILKQSTSFEQRGDEKTAKEPHFDESNIQATLHPPDKDYGFMKIEEPKTPFEVYESDGEDQQELDANLLSAKIAAEGNKGPRPRRISEPSADPEDLLLLSPEEREKRKSFESKRKKHYNEFQAVKMARQLMVEDEDSEEGDNIPDIGEKSKNNKSGSNSPMDTETKD